MTDFHAHVLPGMDDGSRSLDESLELLTRLAEQGITTVCATPHYYASDETPQQFLRRRSRAVDELYDELTYDLPNVRIGAEVCYYSGISRMEALHSLCLNGTDLLLLEMPFTAWSSRVFDELREISRRGDIKPVLAHIDRYPEMRSSATLRELCTSGFLMQVNASAFLDRNSKRWALHALEHRAVTFIGSDCHNVSSRAPKLGEALDVIRKKAGEGILRELEASSRYFIGE